LDLSNKDIGRATSNSATGTPIVTTAKTAGLAVPNSHIVHMTNSITTKPIKRPFIAVLIIAPKAASVGGLFISRAAKKRPQRWGWGWSWDRPNRRQRGE
jgi:hypothetical protein